MSEILHIYTRVSTTSQEDDGTSIETQKEHGINRSKKLGMKYKVWNEGGKSSSKDDLSNREVLTELLHQIDEGNIKHLYVWNTDRLSRNQNTWGLIRFKLIKNDVILHTPTGKQILSDPQTNLMLGIMSEISQYDNLLRTERTRLGKVNRIKKGYWMGGPPPYGYSIEKSKLVINKEEQKWVKYIFESYSKGDSVDTIRSNLLKNVVYTRRKKPVWSHGSLQKLLTNTHYGGYYYFTDKKSEETIRCQCPRILEPMLIEKVKTEIKKRSYHSTGKRRRSETGKRKHDYLLTGLLVCGECESFFTGRTINTQSSYYFCLQKTHKYKTKNTAKHKECKMDRNLRIDYTDNLVWSETIKILQNSFTFKDMVKSDVLKENNYKNSKKNKKSLDVQLKKLEKEISQIESSLVTLETDSLIGKRSKKDVKKIITNLENHLLSVQVKKDKVILDIKRNKEESGWVDWVSKFGEKIEVLKDQDITVKEKKDFLKGIIEEIKVKEIDKQEMTLEIRYKYSFVGDRLKYLDNKNKKLGYSIIEGSNQVSISGKMIKKKKLI